MPKKNMKLRSHLIALVVVAVLPVVIFTGVIVYVSYQQQKADLSRGMVDTARALSTALDREFLISIQSLKMLATSNRLDKGQLAEFYGEMKAALTAYGRAWQNIALLDPTGQQLINLQLPFGPPLPRIDNPELLDRIVRSREAAVSDLFRGSVTGAPTIVVSVPVLKDGQVKYLINAGLSPQRLLDLLSQQKLPPGWIASIIDRNKIILARTQVPEKFVGTPATPTLAAKTRESEEGWFQGVTKDNVAVYMAFSRSRLSGWTVALGIPIAGVEASLKRSLVLTGIGGSALLLVAVVLAAVLARRIARPVSALSRAAEKLGRGETVKIPPSQIAELNQVGRVLETAATQRAQVEEALREQESKLVEAQALAKLGSWEFDPATQTRTWSVEMYRLYGRDPSLGPMSYAEFKEIIHPDDRELFRRVEAQAIAERRAIQLEFRIVPANGGVRWIAGHGKPIFDDAGRLVRLVGTAQDTTERRQMEELLRQSEERFSAFMNNTSVQTWIKDRDFRYVYCNRPLEILLGKPLDSILGKNDFELWPLKTAEELRANDEAVFASDKLLETFETVPDPNGQLRYSRVYKFPLKDSHGQRFVGGMAVDITERKQAEDALRKSEEQLRLSLDAARMGTWEVNVVTGDVSWSHNYEALFGLSPGTSPRTREAFLALVHPDDRKSVDEVFRRAIEVDAEYFQEFRICWPDGSVHWILGVGRANRDDTGRPVRVTGVGMDITERKQAEQALQARYREQQWLHEISELVLTSRDLKATAETIIDKALSASLCDLGIIRLLTSAAARLEVVASQGYLDPENLTRHRNNPSLPGSRGEIMRFFARKQTIVVEMVPDEPGLRTFKGEGVQSLIMVPVVAGQEILGLLQLGSRTPRKFEPDLINFLETLGSHFGIALQKTTLLEEALVGQAQLRDLSRRLVEAQEIERRDIARELHDEIGSLLTGLKLTLDLSARSGTDRTNPESISAQSLIGELFAKVRSLSQSLRPPMLDDLGLLASLSWHVKEFTAHTGVQVDFQHYDLERRFSAEVEIAAYRIVQEALTNVARHAQVKEATVTLWADQNLLGLEISDRGAGFDQTAILARASGAGLAGMRERVAQLGGSIEITSDPGAGTSITVELPLN
jgi:PAS domain S-box-containing protein